MTKKAIKAKLPNGFTFIIDFIPDESNIDVDEDIRSSWVKYYSSIGITSAEISVTDLEEFQLPVYYNRLAFRMFRKPFAALTHSEKVAVVESANNL